MPEEPKFFNPWTEISRTRTKLPHWQQPGATYFVTFRMADSLPAAKRADLEEQKKAWLIHHPEPWDKPTTKEYHVRFSAEVERWLDAGHGSCFLQAGAPRQIVTSALLHFDHDRYFIHSSVVMPNHVHALVSLHPDHTLEKILHSWKSFTAHELVKEFPSAPNPFWQSDYFDRLIRNKKHFENCTRYIQNNPEKANLPKGQFDLLTGS